MFQIYRGGCNTRHSDNFFMSRPEGTSTYLLLVVKTPALFHVDNRTVDVTPCQAVVITPGTPYSYSNPCGEYMDDWLHFDCPGEDALNGLAVNNFFQIANADLISFYIRQLLTEQAYTDISCRQENIDSLMRVLLNHLYLFSQNKRAVRGYGPYDSALRQARITLQSNIASPPSAEKLASQIGISVSHFQHLYTNLFGIPFQKDIIQIRVNYVKYLLETSGLTMEQIMENSGYFSETHFYRQFRQMTGMTPADYRRAFREPAAEDG